MLQTTLSGAFLASVHTLHSFVIIEKTQVSALLFWEHAFSIVVGIQCKPNATRNEEFSSLTGMDVLVPGFCPCLILFSPMEVVHTSTEGLLFVLRVQEGTHLKFELAVDWINGLLPDACLIDVVIATRQFLTTVMFCDRSIKNRSPVVFMPGTCTLDHHINATLFLDYQEYKWVAPIVLDQYLSAKVELLRLPWWIYFYSFTGPSVV